MNTNAYMNQEKLNRKSWTLETLESPVRNSFPRRRTYWGGGTLDPKRDAASAGSFSAEKSQRINYIHTRSMFSYHSWASSHVFLSAAVGQWSYTPVKICQLC